VTGPLGAQFLVWEYATAVAGKVLGINPFDQPNVTESKENTARYLELAGPQGLPIPAPLLVDDKVEIHGDAGLLGSATSLPEAIDALLARVPGGGYLAVMAYLDRIGDARAAGLRPALARRLKDRQVTFGWGPRFLHSTGQFHKGGPQLGAFLQVTGVVTEDLEVPGRPWSLGTLQLAQALGDLDALAGRTRPVLRLHLTDRRAGLDQVLAAVAR
jgi:glucose-6-phosphate isomerase